MEALWRCKAVNFAAPYRTSEEYVSWSIHVHFIIQWCPKSLYLRGNMEHNLRSSELNQSNQGLITVNHNLFPLCFNAIHIQLQSNSRYIMKNFIFNEVSINEIWGTTSVFFMKNVQFASVHHLHPSVFVLTDHSDLVQYNGTITAKLNPRYSLTAIRGVACIGFYWLLKTVLIRVLDPTEETLMFWKCSASSV